MSYGDKRYGFWNYLTLLNYGTSYLVMVMGFRSSRSSRRTKQSRTNGRFQTVSSPPYWSMWKVRPLLITLLYLSSVFRIRRCERRRPARNLDMDMPDSQPSISWPDTRWSAHEQIVWDSSLPHCGPDPSLQRWCKKNRSKKTTRKPFVLWLLILKVHHRSF